MRALNLGKTVSLSVLVLLRRRVKVELGTLLLGTRVPSELGTAGAPGRGLKCVSGSSSTCRVQKVNTEDAATPPGSTSLLPGPPRQDKGAAPAATSPPARTRVMDLVHHHHHHHRLR
jgi:hypothetical protein